MRRFLARLHTFIRPARAERELTRELESHLALLEEDFSARGLSAAEARQAARRAFGMLESVKEQQRDARSIPAFEDARRDLRYAGRALRRAPGFAGAAVATLAIGIGASTAIFSVAYGVSLRPLPYPDPDRLIRIYEAHPGHGKLREDVSVGAFHDWREGAASIESAAIYTKPRSRYLTGPGDRRLIMMSVSPAFFDVLGIRPLLGQGFKAEREYTRFTTKDVVLSHAAWQRVLGGRQDVVGSSIELTGVGDNDVFRVVGVLPADFVFTEPVDAWYPQIVEVPVARMLRNWRYDRVIARLRPGASIEQARVELEAVAARQGQALPTIHGGWTVTIESFHASIVGRFGRVTWLLLAAVGVVLLVTALNVGGLLIARSVARERETAVRVALGAGGWRLMRLWLAEAVLIGAAGVSGGLFIAWSTVNALKSAAPPGIPRLDSVALDASGVGVACLATLLSVVFFTTAPLRTVPPGSLLDGLRAASAHAGDRPGRHAARAVLTLAQCAGAACLIVLAFMLTRSFLQLMAVDLGWEPKGVLTQSVDPPMPRELRRPWFRYLQWSDRLVARLEATPGIQRAAITTQIPFSPLSSVSTLARGRHTATDALRWPAVGHTVTDGYFDVMGIRLLSGRTFAAEDRFTEAQLISWPANERGVVVVSESTARVLWPGRSPVGEALWLPDIDNVSWREVIGVVEDIQFHDVGESPALHVFIPYTQSSSARARLMVRGTLPSEELMPTVRAVIQTVEPGTRVDNVAMLDAIVARATAQPRFATRVVAGFGLVALLVAAVGIYGTLSYVVASRRREIGIRLALGAPRQRIVSTLLWRGALPATIGAIVGTLGAALFARTFNALFFQVAALDGLSMAGGALVVLLAGIAASVIPSVRAGRIDPIVALRAD